MCHGLAQLYATEVADLDHDPRVSKAQSLCFLVVFRLAIHHGLSRHRLL